MKLNVIINLVGTMLALLIIGRELHMAGMPKPIKLDANAAAAYERFVKANEQVSKMRKHDKIAKEAKEQLKEAFGDAKFGELPDGRIVQRLTEEQNRSKQPAKLVEIVKFKEFSID